MMSIAEIPGLRIWQFPVRTQRGVGNKIVMGYHYAAGADPAEGNPNSDDSACSVMCYETGEQVATFATKSEPAVFARYLHVVALWYNNAHIMVERNNHGHAVLLWLRDNSNMVVMCGDDGKPGWMTSEKSKSLLFDKTTMMVRDKELKIYDEGTLSQLADIEIATLRAPLGLKDDKAIAFVLSAIGILRLGREAEGEQYATPQANESIEAEGEAARRAVGEARRLNAEQRLIQQYGCPE
jgi:hypothetical protein